MQITLPVMPAAPLVSGHPYGLPGLSPRSPDPRRVEAADKSQTDGRVPDRRLANAPAIEELETALRTPSEHVAPPSIMQLRIAAILDASGDAGVETTDPSDNTSPNPYVSLP